MTLTMAKTRGFLLTLVWCSLTASLVVGVAQTAAPGPSAMEQELFRMLNAARSEQGLAPMQWDDSLARAARAHAELLLQNGQLSHQFPGESGLAIRVAQAGTHFQTVAENIAEGPGVDSVQKQWMKLTSAPS